MDVFFFGLSIIAWKGLSYCKCKQIVEEKPITHTTLQECSDDEEGEDCANCPNGMEGSVKAYDRHVVICDTRHDWPKSIDNNKFFPYSVISKLEAKKNEVKIMVTGCRHITDCDDDQVEVIVYPDDVAFRLKEADFDTFADLMTSKNRLKLEDLQSLPFKASKPFTEKLIMVCTHKRDARCQTLGPQIIVEMRRLLNGQNVAERSIAVRQTSHIGGHTFAGTMIVYPQGVWYGKVTAKGVRSLLRAIQEGRQHAKCFRGQAVGKAIEW